MMCIFRTRNEYLIFQKIIKLEYEFPEKFFPKAKDLVKQLLVGYVFISQPSLTPLTTGSVCIYSYAMCKANMESSDR